MKYILPANHGLPERILGDPDLLPKTEEGTPSLTDVQYEALSQGVARGTSMLVVAPTSTGKTLIGIWALSSWLFARPGRHAVYLVTHRALARQKFEEFVGRLSDRYLGGDKSGIVLANGDAVEDGAGGVPTDPLGALILVATYEKYLAMVSGSGIRSDMSHCVIICDEIQILGDQNRGRSVEVLLTLLRKTRWGQLIGLSAVIDARDARDLREWFNATLIRLDGREKHLHYECRTPSRVLSFRTDKAEAGIQSTAPTPQAPNDTALILEQLLKNKDALPVVVFCMTRRKVEQLSQAHARKLGLTVSATQPLLPELRESTTAARELSRFIPKRFAFHSAELIEEERILVESKLESKQLDLVFATSTLAAGVNFPFKTAVFDDWKRWDDRSKGHVPMPASEFHNMAGRVGRMGSGHSHGSVIFTAKDNYQERQSVTSYLNPDQSTPLTPRVTPDDFNQLALQLVSSGVCQTQEEVSDFLSSTFSAMRELESNKMGLSHWTSAMSQSIQALRTWGFML
ncbi:DEAD/DEAH box helicase domain protein [Cystobacter fuscus DSM 2262]|uniref:DEAD/DEAH box helicase domain protein n=1 Tax=Cystobacter fuscus (strain ATCC 25194 / DSM 2262 / NBRC 100088 / M29) TaxID=1242864 RepID=S9P2D5_CYSF2|nr:DEAD/DEAH box helicase [Cystobacter fuscus]EPX56432.1 DEAD/DEAH box helicase domain protein [Cystobacter fuscus DSM 2262]